MKTRTKIKILGGAIAYLIVNALLVWKLSEWLAYRMLREILFQAIVS